MKPLRSITIEPSGPLAGRIRVPGDKSITHRGFILGAMGRGVSHLAGTAPGGDVRSTTVALEALGAAITLSDHGAQVAGEGWNVESPAVIDAGNSATTVRLLAGAVSGRPGSYLFTGDDSLSRRPMDRIADPLRRMGAGVELSPGGTPPLTVRGGRLRGIDHHTGVASAQVKGAIILAALQAEGRTVIVEPHASRDHTERLLAWLGIDVDYSAGRVVVGAAAGIPLPAFRLEVPGDFSSAAYFMTAACLVPGSELVIERVGLNPSRTGLLDVLRAMGAEVEAEVTSADPEPEGTLHVRSAPLRGVQVPESEVPRIIDELPLVALAATQAEGETLVGGAGELRVKESDRIEVLVAGLRALGAAIDDLEDGFVVSGPTPLKGGQVDPDRDHRLALTFAVAGLAAMEEVTVEGWGSTDVSYPGFLDALREVQG